MEAKELVHPRWAQVTSMSWIGVRGAADLKAGWMVQEVAILRKGLGKGGV